MGAGAFMASVTRLTVALAVIMVEISDDVHMLLPVLTGGWQSCLGCALAVAGMKRLRLCSAWWWGGQIGTSSASHPSPFPLPLPKYPRGYVGA